MNNFDAIILGAIQGITEFLPISSSGHLVVFEDIMGLHVEGLKEFDVILHFATFFSILIFFRKDIWKMILALPSWIKMVGRFLSGNKKGKLAYENEPETRTITYLLIATIPAGVIGILLGDLIDNIFRDIKFVLGMMIISALIFVFAEFYSKRYKIDKKGVEEKDLGIFKAILIGSFQALALIPGISRSGSTISAGLIGGMKRAEAARFSFFLGSIAIFGAAIITLKDIDFNESMPLMPMILGFISSFIFGILSIGFLMKFLKKHSLIVFAVYLVAFSVGGYFLL